MKRFVIPFVLSAVYVSLLVLVFSSDFSKKNSFFFHDSKADEAVTTVETPAVPDQVLKGTKVATTLGIHRQDSEGAQGTEGGASAE